MKLVVRRPVCFQGRQILDQAGADQHSHVPDLEYEIWFE